MPKCTGGNSSKRGKASGNEETRGNGHGDSEREFENVEAPEESKQKKKEKEKKSNSKRVKVSTETSSSQEYESDGVQNRSRRSSQQSSEGISVQEGQEIIAESNRRSVTSAQFEENDE